MDGTRDLTLLQSGIRNRHIEAARSGISDGEILKIKSTFAFSNKANDWKFKLNILHHANGCLL